MLIDASQGVEAQTIANLYMAVEHNLTIIPVINKIDLASADIPACLHQIDHDLGLDTDMTIQVSAKTGFGVDALFEAIVKYIEPPKGNDQEPLQALDL
ncbi:GTP-binding protein [uncultured Sphaerochaeta sp.]|uniref:GTP-binding protein n=1 Tax=uncultured Sphaerochaeta sp. TaxID=886478 RepID=UPI002A0A15E9|nr:GTP-binding protein [uncultured Sphaerochaeta sp.]